MSKIFNTHTLSFLAGAIVGSVSSYVYCRYNRNCNIECPRSDSNGEYVKELGKVVRV